MSQTVCREAHYRGQMRNAGEKVTELTCSRENVCDARLQPKTEKRRWLRSTVWRVPSGNLSLTGN